jgi:transcriptional antiterminator Rof (Rho-off)
MKIQTFLRLHTDACAHARDLTHQKGHDYSGEADTLRNVKTAEMLGICTAEQGVVIRLGDKLNRLAQLTKPDAIARVKDESVNDTLLDMINYSVLLLALRAEKADIGDLPPWLAAAFTDPEED